MVSNFVKIQDCFYFSSMDSLETSQIYFFFNFQCIFKLVYNKMEKCGAGESDQWVKSLLNIPEDLSLDTQYPSEHTM